MVIKEFSEYDKVNDHAQASGRLTEKLEKAQEKVKSFNDREQLFKQPISEHETLIELMAEF